MGTFHHNHGELHGITVVVETRDERLYVGRCHEENETEVVLLDVDVHEDPDPGAREEYLSKAVRFGVWKKHGRLVLPRPEVVSLRRLGELSTG